MTEVVAVLLPDQAWHQVEPGSYHAEGGWFSYTDADSGQRVWGQRHALLAVAAKE